MSYTIEREDAAEDARVLRAAIKIARSFVGGDATPMKRLIALAVSIEEQVTPKVEEPTEFGSLVSAWGPTDPDDVAADTWQLSPAHGKHYWQSQSGKVEVWAELTLNPVEVLRVGIGERESADEWHRLDVADAQTEAYTKGAEGLRLKILDRLRILLSAAITAERKDAYEIAIRTAEGTRP